MSRPLISVDVGGTLCHVEGPNIVGVLAGTSPLGARRARQIMRQHLHTVPEITGAIKREICAALMIPASAFPDQPTSPVLHLVPGAVDVLRELSALSTVITLSNVTCVEADTESLRRQLAPWVNNHFPSYRIGYSKPDPRAFLTAAAHYGMPVEQMVHIGDDWECDVVGATSIGITAIWISHGRPVPDDGLLDEPGVLVANNLAATVQHVRKLTRRLA